MSNRGDNIVLRLGRIVLRPGRQGGQPMSDSGRRLLAALAGQTAGEGHSVYDVTLARLGRDVETIRVRANSAEQAILKAERYLHANIFARTVTQNGMHLWPPGSEREGLTIEQAADCGVGRVPDAPLTDLSRRGRKPGRG